MIQRSQETLEIVHYSNLEALLKKATYPCTIRPAVPGRDDKLNQLAFNGLTARDEVLHAIAASPVKLAIFYTETGYVSIISADDTTPPRLG
jgi:hypothetical protein